MHKRPSYWPSDRSLFRDKSARRSAVVWIMLVAVIAAGLLVVAFWSHPLP